MFTLKKTPGRDFVILNLTDPQLANEEWNEGNAHGALLKRTVDSLMERAKPDLVTVSGDIAWAGHLKSYGCFADMLDSYGVPWAPVWGNHDSQGGAEMVNKQADIMLAHKYCLYEKGESGLGNGNYVIKIAENGKTRYGVIMMDSHNRAPYTDADGKTCDAWAKLTPGQVEWYRGQVLALGGAETCVITHIPIYAYRLAFAEAWNDAHDPKSVQPGESSEGRYWNEGYKSSYGVKYERISSYPADEGMFDAILELGSTKTVLAGHDHVNNFVIEFRGVTLCYALKTGLGCYWDERLNGGTAVRVTDKGALVEHVFVDP